MRQDTAVVVEGYTDVIAMHIAGMPIAVATCGTALGSDHLDLLRRFSERVVFAFDADEAGAGAALRGFDRSVPGDLDLRIASLPDGKDPADVVASGDLDRLRKAITDSEPLLKFRIETELGHYDLDEPEARAKAVHAAAAVIALHPDPVTRHEYAVLVSRSTGVELRFVESAMRRGGQATTSEEPPPGEQGHAGTGTAVPHSGTYRIEEELLRLMLANDERLAGVDLDPELFADERLRVAYERAKDMLDGVPAGEPPDLGAAIGSEDSPTAELLRRLALDDRPLPEPFDIVSLLEIARIEGRIDEIKRQLQRIDRDADAQGYSELWQRLIALEQSKRDLRSDR